MCCSPWRSQRAGDVLATEQQQQKGQVWQGLQVDPQCSFFFFLLWVTLTKRDTLRPLWSHQDPMTFSSPIPNLSIKASLIHPPRLCSFLARCSLEGSLGEHMLKTADPFQPECLSTTGFPKPKTSKLEPL